MHDKERVLLKVRRLSKVYERDRHGDTIKALRDVHMDVYEGETLGVVGESGCGKTTFAKCILRVIEPTEGEVWFRFDDGRWRNVLSLSRKEVRSFWREVQYVFQDPWAALNPKMSVFEALFEPLAVHGLARDREFAREQIARTMDLVRLPRSFQSRYPGELSGGERQRVVIARALMLKPRVIILDEPVSALDVSVRAQILNLLRELKEQLNLTLILISHDLSTIDYMADRICVMYLGRVVEIGDRQSVLQRPLHPYTELLLASVPVAHPRLRGRRRIPGKPLDDEQNPFEGSGCPFRDRCLYAKPKCSDQVPVLVEVEYAHKSACHYAAALELLGVENRA